MIQIFDNMDQYFGSIQQELPGISGRIDRLEAF